MVAGDAAKELAGCGLGSGELPFHASAVITLLFDSGGVDAQVAIVWPDSMPVTRVGVWKGI